MILSQDKTKVFFNVPKTGSLTVRELLKPISTRIGEQDNLPEHYNRNYLAMYYRQYIDPNITQDELDNITGYAFWRDPIERFRSQFNFARQSSEFYRAVFPEFFGAGAPFDMATLNLPKRLTTLDYNRIPKRIRDKIDDILTPENFFWRIHNIPDIHILVYPQSHWFAHTNMVVLNYHDFENEARKLIGLFGGDTSVTIPALNVSESFLPNIPIPPELEDHIRTLYGFDYHYDPRNLS